MIEELKDFILEEFECGRLNLKDPTVGMFGSFAHQISAPFAELGPFPGTDLGNLIRERQPPFEAAAEGNYYAKVTLPYEASLRASVLASQGGLQPKDLMRMALKATDGNYVMASMTLHNFLKNTAYTGRKTKDEPTNDPVIFYDTKMLDNDKFEDMHVADVADKLANLRGDPSAGDKMGPWYHMFGVQMMSALCGGFEAFTGAKVEQIGRYVKGYWDKSYSQPDSEKAAWDDGAISIAAIVGPILYGKKEPPSERSLRVFNARVYPGSGPPGTEFTIEVEYAVSGMTDDFPTVAVKETGKLVGPQGLVPMPTERTHQLPPSRVFKEWKVKPTAPGKYNFNYSLDEKCSCKTGTLEFQVGEPQRKVGWTRRIQNVTRYQIQGLQLSTNPDTGAERFTFVDTGTANRFHQGAITIELSKLPDRLVVGRQYSLKQSIVQEDFGCAVCSVWVQGLPDDELYAGMTAIDRPGARIRGGYYGRPNDKKVDQHRNPSGTINFTIPESYLEPWKHPNNPHPEIKVAFRCENGAHFDVFYTYNGLPEAPAGGAAVASTYKPNVAPGDQPGFTSPPTSHTATTYGAPSSNQQPYGVSSNNQAAPLGTPSTKTQYTPPPKYVRTEQAPLGTPSTKTGDTSGYLEKAWQTPKVAEAIPKYSLTPAPNPPVTATSPITSATAAGGTLQPQIYASPVKTINALKQELTAKYQMLAKQSGQAAAEKYIADEAAAGNAAAQEQLGLIAQRGQKYGDAAYWFEKAARQGERNSQNNLGLLYYQGRGVPKDHRKAVIWMSKAAQQNLPQAQTSLGQFYLNGTGVPKDNKEGIRWLKMAARNGSKDAAEILDKLDVDDDD